jgi:hypothetical protein
LNQHTFSAMKCDDKTIARIWGAMFAECDAEIAEEAARRIVRLWNQTLHLSTEAIDRGEFLHVSPPEAWSSLSLTAFSAWLAALERKQPHRDIEAGSLSRIATLLSAAQRALEQTPVVPLPANEATG